MSLTVEHLAKLLEAHLPTITDYEWRCACGETLQSPSYWILHVVAAARVLPRLGDAPREPRTCEACGLPIEPNGHTCSVKLPCLTCGSIAWAWRNVDNTMFPPRSCSVCSPRLLRKDDTPEGKKIWDAVDRCAARAPEWVKERLGAASRALHTHEPNPATYGTHNETAVCLHCGDHIVFKDGVWTAERDVAAARAPGVPEMEMVPVTRGLFDEAVLEWRIRGLSNDWLWGALFVQRPKA